MLMNIVLTQSKVERITKLGEIYELVNFFDITPFKRTNELKN